jgi:hypothetical protein
MLDEPDFNLEEITELVNKVENWEYEKYNTYTGSVEDIKFRVYKLETGFFGRKITGRIVAFYDNTLLGDYTNLKFLEEYKRAESIYQQNLKEKREDGLNKARRLLDSFHSSMKISRR